MKYPQIIRRGQMALLGISELGDSRTDIPGLWTRFAQMEPRILESVPTARYIVITWGTETEMLYKHFLYVGVEVTRILAPPLFSTIKIIPAGQYAVFSTWARTLDDVWSFALETWLPESDYSEPGFIIQRYDRQRYLEAKPYNKEIDIMIPLRRKDAPGPNDAAHPQRAHASSTTYPRKPQTSRSAQPRKPGSS